MIEEVEVAALATNQQVHTTRGVAQPARRRRVGVYAQAVVYTSQLELTGVGKAERTARTNIFKPQHLQSPTARSRKAQCGRREG